MQRRFLGLLLLGIVSGCQSGERVVPRMAVIEVATESPTVCRVSIDGSSFALPAQENAFVAELRVKAKFFPNAHIKADPSVTYRCVGGTIVLAQEAGFQRIGFIAEPPPPTKR